MYSICLHHVNNNENEHAGGLEDKAELTEE